jgi:hypothetical protein
MTKSSENEAVEVIGLRRAYDGDVGGIEAFLRFVAVSVGTISLDASCPEGLVMRLRSLKSDAERTAEFAAGIMAAKQGPANDR